MLQQGTEKSIFGVIFLIGFDTITTWILQNYISRFNSHGIESFDSWVCYFGEPMKNKKLVNVAARNGEEHLQSEFSKYLWDYHYNDAAQNHFQIQLISNWKFW